MNSEDRVQEALRALAAEDRALAASYRIELRARAAFRRKQGERMLARAIGWGLAAAAAVIVTIAMSNGSFRTKQRPLPKTASRATPVLAVNDFGKFQDLNLDDSVQSSDTSDFIPLTVGLPADDGEFLVRVQLSAQVAQTVGYPIAPDRLDQPVEADVLVGEEGVARAIRFVREDE